MDYEILHVLIRGYVLGLTLAVPLGPISIEIIRRGLAERPNAGYALGLGACSVDGVYAVLAGLSLGWILRMQWLIAICYVLGALLLGWMGWGALRGGWRQWRLHGAGLEGAIHEAETRHLERRPLWKSYLTGVAMTATAPINIAFWLTVPARFFGGAPPGLGLILLTSGAVLLGTFSWVTVLRLLIGIGRRWLNPRMLAAVSLAGGVGLLGFAAWMAVGALRLLS